MRKKILSPIHPGEVLQQDLLEPMGLSQYRLAKGIRVPPRRINEIVHGNPAWLYNVDSMGGRVVTRVQKWGNSLGLRIPKSFAAEAKVGEGSSVELSIEKGALVVRPLRRRYTLDELLARVTKSNIHGELSSGAPMGREAW